MAQYLKTESIGSIGSIILAILEVRVYDGAYNPNCSSADRRLVRETSRVTSPDITA